jgi:hypothetical protein
MGKKKPEPKSPYNPSQDMVMPTVNTQYGSANYDKASNTVRFDNPQNQHLVSARDNAFKAYDASVKDYNSFIDNPMQNKQYSQVYLPEFEDSQKNQFNNFIASLGNRMRGSSGQLLAAKRADDNAQLRAALPFQFQQQILLPQAQSQYQLGRNAQDSLAQDFNSLLQAWSTAGQLYSNQQNRLSATTNATTNANASMANAQAASQANTLNALATAYTASQRNNNNTTTTTTPRTT